MGSEAPPGERVRAPASGAKSSARSLGAAGANLEPADNLDPATAEGEAAAAIQVPIAPPGEHPGSPHGAQRMCDDHGDAVAAAKPAGRLKALKYGWRCHPKRVHNSEVKDIKAKDEGLALHR